MDSAQRYDQRPAGPSKITALNRPCGARPNRRALRTMTFHIELRISALIPVLPRNRESPQERAALNLDQT